jgi:hypothetical protein
MNRHLLIAISAISVFACTPQPPVPPLRPAVDQGPNWNLDTRAKFYTQDQGSQLIPLRWITALKQPDGQPFLANSLNRYGYLTNDLAPTSILPVGFVPSGPLGSEALGLTCAACHTRQIEVKGTRYRIDGGPAIVDFQSFLTDLDKAVKTVIDKPDAFADFAAGVFGQTPTPEQQAQLLSDVKAWFLRYDTQMHLALPGPAHAWGASRLDAVAMIFDRLTGLDLGPAPSYLIPANIKVADAPVRYPFLWNAPIQDYTQWPGFAPNGNDLYGLTRNLGEVFGVFATFHPEKDQADWLLKINYTKTNSANFDGLGKLEDLIKKIGPPKFQWNIDAALAKKGEEIFGWETAKGGCVECHGIKPGEQRFPQQKTWATPILDVQTDSREYQILARTAQTGVLSGAPFPGAKPLKPVDDAFNVLKTAVGGSILQKIIPAATAPESEVRSNAAPGTATTAAAANSTLAATPEAQQVSVAFQKPAAGTFKYESRVLQGIWATAPYLHNGSVPTLADLLNPAAERPASFQVGPIYDPDKVGLAAEQTGLSTMLTTTGCDARDSGNSRCGHEFGTTLSADDKKALLEYLKTL